MRRLLSLVETPLDSLQGPSWGRETSSLHTCDRGGIAGGVTCRGITPYSAVMSAGPHKSLDFLSEGGIMLSQWMNQRKEMKNPQGGSSCEAPKKGIIQSASAKSCNPLSGLPELEGVFFCSATTKKGEIRWLTM